MIRNRPWQISRHKNISFANSKTVIIDVMVAIFLVLVMVVIFPFMIPMLLVFLMLLLFLILVINVKNAGVFMLIAVKNVVMHTVMIALLSECQVATIKTYSSCFF